MSEEISDQKDVLLAYIERQWSQAQQCEDQRAAAINVILLAFGAIQGYVVQRNFDQTCLPLIALLLLIPGYGAVLSAKYYERFRLSTARVGCAMEKLNELFPTVSLKRIEELAEVKHRTRYPRLKKLRLNHLWSGFFVALLLLGAANFWFVLKISDADKKPDQPPAPTAKIVTPPAAQEQRRP